MIKEEFYFDSRDGESRIHAVRYTPDDGNVKGIVQVVHGMAEYVERYENLAEFLTARGILVTGEDHLGHGKSVAEGGTYGYFCEQDPATVVVRDVCFRLLTEFSVFSNGRVTLFSISEALAP